MKSIEEIRNDLRGIQHYYRNKDTFDSSIALLGKPSFYDTMEKYEKYIVNAPKRLQDVYECLYRQGKAQKIVAIEWHVTEKYIQILNKRLILYFQGVLEWCLYQDKHTPCLHVLHKHRFNAFEILPNTFSCLNGC